MNVYNNHVFWMNAWVLSFRCHVKLMFSDIHMTNNYCLNRAFCRMWGIDQLAQLPELRSALNMILAWPGMTTDLQMLFFSWERVGEVFLIFHLAIHNFRLQGCSDFLHKHVDLLRNAASRTDFIFLKMTWQHGSVHHMRIEYTDLRLLLNNNNCRTNTFIVGILSFMNSASRQRTSQGACIFKNPTPGILVWKTKINKHGLSI